MTSLAHNSVDTKRPAKIDWAQWISAVDAARLLDMDRAALARKCGNELASKGLALMARPPQGGKVSWFLNRRFDHRLAADTASAGLPTSAGLSEQLARLPQNKREQAQQRAACVNLLRAWRATEPGRQKDWMPRLLTELARQFPGVAPAQRTLLKWDQVYKTASDLLQLVDTRGGDQRSGVSPDAWAEFERRWLDEREPSIAKTHREVALIAKEQGWTWCPLHTCRRMVEDRIPPEKQALHRQPALYRTKFAPKIAQDPERYHAGRCWVGDHTTLDFWVRWGERVIRPTLTAWQDWRTRKIVGCVLTEGPSADTILASLRIGLLDPSNMGGPTEVLVDNGKDYDSWTLQGTTKSERLSHRITRGKVETDTPAFAGIFGLLNIKVGHSLAYNPNGKARMERFFRTLHEDFDRSQSTYCGRSSDHRPEYLNDLLRNQPHQVPTAVNIIERLKTWIGWYNDRAEHDIDDLSVDGRKVSPNAAMAAWCTSPLLRDTGGALDMMLLRWHKPVSVTQKGVTIATYGTPLSYGQGDPMLLAYKGQGKCVMVAVDPDNLNIAQVYDLQLRHICEVKQNEFGGQRGEVGHRQVRAMVKAQRQYTQSVKNADANRHFEIYTAGEMIAAGLDKPTPPEPAPGNIKFPTAEPVPTSGGGGKRKPAEQVDTRKAAGAEHDQAPPDRMTFRAALSQRASRAMLTEDDHDEQPETPRGSFLSAFRQRDLDEEPNQ